MSDEEEMEPTGEDDNGEIDTGLEECEESEDEEITRDYTNVPILVQMVCHIEKTPDDEDLTRADVEYCKKHRWEYGYDAKANPGISCGGIEGFGGRFESEEECINHLKGDIRSMEDKYKEYNRPVKMQVILNGNSYNPNNKNLTAWFQ